MYKIFIDSTEFRSDPARISKAFGQLSQLAILGYIEINLSRINVDEIESSIIETLEKQEKVVVDAIAKSLNYGVAEKINSTGHTQIKLNSDWFKKVIDNATDKFKIWLKETKVVLHEIEADDGKKVMKSYFSGHPPFRQPKSREDIPDAFIWEVITRLNRSKVNEFYFVSGDNTFREKIKSEFKNIKTFANLKELFDEPSVQKLVKDWEYFTKQANNEALIELIKSELRLQEKDLNNELMKQIEEHLISEQLNLNRGKFQGAVTSINFHEDLIMELDYAQIIKHPNLYLKFETEVELTFTLSVPIWDGDVRRNISDYSYFDRIYENDDNSTDTHFRAEEYKLCKVSGEAFIELPTLNSGSGKEEVIDAVSECELRTSKIRIERLN